MGSEPLRRVLIERTFHARSSTERMPSRKTGERTGSRPSAAEGGGAPRASLEAVRSPVYINTVAPREPGFLAPVAARFVTARLGLSVGRPGPRAFASASVPFVRTNQSCAAPRRPSHPALHVRDDREAPLRRARDGGSEPWIAEKRKQNIFAEGAGLERGISFWGAHIFQRAMTDAS